ncbi:hypothetical protein C351_03530 [Cryptococcus neoformans c8]|nr:hypothetical protein C353_01169 [Cryptococcus neoformans var. grubii AD1-83a]OXG62835.1 hypothetical protein C351_03530 [Cryptococcus neoformans var. grubii c8]OXG71080.1 hypothetical protein C352_01187 [Cryptococcus neoformans var. grubii CHC193]OXH18616.1 hypothetical protein C370_01159 [Cryptococcus neoformans var. grubii A1-35-8]
MNSYPGEFLAHPQPLMFIAGLSPPTISNPNVDRERSSSVATTDSTRRPSGGTFLDTAVPAHSPSPTAEESLPKSPNVDMDQNGEGILDVQQRDEEGTLPVDERDQQFNELVANLRGALSKMGGKGRVWLDPKGRKEFRILLVEKGVRLPMRKISSPTTTPSLNDPTVPTAPHSPLSPLVPSSPLYPDGLIAPVWVRKHAELIPSVFVLFLRLYESPIRHMPSDETAEETQAREAEEKQKEKEMDDLLIKEIGDRRRKLGERGIKLTVVLMASSQTLDSPALDPRLSYLRRASALSSKASLFVLSPVSVDQLPDFILSLQDALYESSMDYYNAHAKRVRRKRSRVPASMPIHAPTTTAQGFKVLGPQGWAVRYDWKMGWFAEVRGEVDVARRHYEDCWNELAKMFSSTTTLPPRTKRWAEAKVLADCVAVRICKLSLYEGDGSRALNSFHVHLKRFGDLSRGWGIGEETFEFWSWVARQYRVFAELLEMAQQHNLRIIIPPPTFPTLESSAGPQSLSYLATPISSQNPTQVLQHPAYYYYTAACGTLKRQERFKEALDSENDAMGSEAAKSSGYVSSTAPGFANEKKVDHAALVIELFSKAYSLLKDLPSPSNRTALYIAYRIAETYNLSGQHEMAIRFFDRISHSFKNEKWTELVQGIRKMWYESAKAAGSVDGVGKLLLEMMCAGSGINDEEREGLQEEFFTLLKTTSPSNTNPIVIDMDGPSDSELLDVRAGFWQAESVVSKSVPYQVTLRCPDNVIIGDLEFNNLEIRFSDERPPVTFVSSNSVVDEPIQIITTDSGQASLRWQPKQTLVINGLLASSLEGEVQLTSIKLVLKQGSWTFEFVFIPGEISEWTTKKGASDCGERLATSVFFGPQPHAVDLQVLHHPFAFVGETLPIEVKVANNDDRKMNVALSVFLQPTEDGEDEGSIIEAGENRSSTLLQNIPLGLLEPGASSSQSIKLFVPKECTKIVDFSLQSTTQIPSPSNSLDTFPTLDRTEEVSRTVVIPVPRPFVVESSVKLTHKGKIGGEGVVGLTVKVGGPRGMIVEGLELVANADDKEVKTRSSSLEGAQSPEEWNEETSYGVWAVFDLAPGHRGAAGNPVQIPAELVFSWRSESSDLLIKTKHPLPPLFIPPPTDSFLISTLHLPTPPIVPRHSAFPLTVTVLNTHPNYISSQVSVTVDTAENFVWVGDRNVRLPEILPGKEVAVKLECIALGGSGWVKVPKISIWDGTGEEREEVRIRGDGIIYIQP